MKLGPGDHVCSVYETDDQLAAAVAGFLADGLYDRRRMPVTILNGALMTHPVVESAGAFHPNGAYDPEVQGLADIDPSSATPKRRLRRG